MQDQIKRVYVYGLNRELLFIQLPLNAFFYFLKRQVNRMKNNIVSHIFRTSNIEGRHRLRIIQNIKQYILINQNYWQQIRTQMQQSIYNIIPREYNPQVKSPIYRSKYPPNIPPTGSTFCHVTTSKPKVSNLSGEFSIGLQAHSERGNRSTMGYLKHDRKPSPTSFRKKNSGTMGSNILPPIRNFSYDCSNKKALVPRSEEKPIMGLKSDKNFLVSNAIDTILSSAKKMKQEPNWFQKRDFGQVPNYLSKIKASIHNEYSMMQRLHQTQEEQKKMLSTEEIQEIREGLKRRWDQINKQYQMITHLRLIDTTGLMRKKAGLEKQLSQIEDDIKKLNKAYIFVE